MKQLPLYLALITGMSALLLAPAALAKQPNCGRHLGHVNHRQHQQNRRIAQGLASGQLTGREAARLKMQEAQLRRQERFYRRSGNGLSPAERAKLDQKLDRLNQSIYNQKHDNQNR